MSTVVYIPTGFSTPELEILTAKAQSVIDSGEHLVLATCSGGNNYACALNIYGLKSLCFLCKTHRERAFSKLMGSFTRIQSPPIATMSEGVSSESLETRTGVKEINCGKVDVGQSAYSSYLGLSRDQDLEGALAQKSLRKLLETSIALTKWFEQVIQEHGVRRLILYNGRHNTYRPLLRVAEQHQIRVEVIEFSGQTSDCVYEFENCLPQDLTVLSQKIEAAWNHSSGDVEACALDYFSFKRQGGVINDTKSYVLKQKTGLLPSDWNPTQHNIVIFNSSEDEFAALGGEYDQGLYLNQLDAITQICQSLEGVSNLKLWLRIHPNLKNVKWTFAANLLGLEKQYSNIRVISPRSNISSYALLDASDKVVSFGSTIGIEAAYWDKPSILLGRCVYEKLGSVYVPRSHNEAIALILDKELPPLDKTGAKKAAVFWSRGGHAIPHFNGNRKVGFDFNGFKFRKTRIETALYNVMKGVERFFLGELLNYYWSRLGTPKRTRKI